MVFMILTAIVAVLVAVLALQNSMMVDLTLFMWSFRLNLVLVVLISVICGFLLALAWGIKVKTQSMWKMRKLNEQIALLEDDKRILREKVEQLIKAQGGVMDPADTTTTPVAAPDPTPTTTTKKF
ncbi:MAG: LapA family protein [Acidaminococcaceae bacterium]|nr:LapA family protein [Acidaminococcaceae bacterium]MBQ5344919.1 LapA family protein [Acidaminococcaceae bacterium]